MPQYRAGDGIQITGGGELSAKIASSNEIGAVKPDGSTVGVEASGTLHVKKKQVIELSEYNVTVKEGHSEVVTVLKHIGDGTLSASSSNQSVATVSISGSSVIINGIKTGSATITVLASSTSTCQSATAEVNAEIIVDQQTYGVFWTDTSVTAMSRTDDAVDFTDPVITIQNKYTDVYSEGSSPFDNIYPWSEMTVVEIDNIKYVKIPKFYFQLVTNSNTGSKIVGIRISNVPQEGFYTSPAHMNREDGVGERDYIYVSKYLYSSGQSRRPPLRTYINSIAGDNAHIMDFFAYETIQLLFVVEFANWSYSDVIGKGTQPSNLSQGFSESMPYCTGRTKPTSSSSYNPVGTQYRNIESICGYSDVYIEGLTCYGYSRGLYLTANPNLFGQMDSTPIAGVFYSNIHSGYSSNTVGSLRVFNYQNLPILMWPALGNTIKDAWFAGTEQDYYVVPRIPPYGDSTTYYRGIFARSFNEWIDGGGSGAGGFGRIMLLPSA